MRQRSVSSTEEDRRLRVGDVPLDLLHRRYGDVDERTNRLLSNALQAADRAKTLLQRLLGFARRQALQTRPVDIGTLVGGMRDLISSSVGPAIQLQLRIDHDLPAAMADPNQLELAVLNLCVNARDAMPNGGPLTILAEEVAIGPMSSPRLKPGLYLRVSVLDAGVGMDSETLARAVEPFYSTKEFGRGTGLGLSMVHGLAAQLGGGFLLTSAPGEGTRADLYLPVAAEAARVERQVGSEPAQSVGRPLKVLLIDDEDLVREATAEMIRDLGHEVVEASGGSEALARLDDGLGVDVVVTDYMMPGMNGGHLAARLGKSHPEIPVLLVTGYMGPTDDVLHLPRLSKPFGQQAIARALAELFAGDDNVVRLHGRKPADSA